jgi:class 3 adenylate cyclase
MKAARRAGAKARSKSDSKPRAAGKTRATAKPARKPRRPRPRPRAAAGSKPRRPRVSAPHPRRELERLLAMRNEHPERLGDIDRQIHEAFAETHAVMVLDMCGFSRLTARYGIIHFLSMIHRLHGIVLPIVRAHGGTVVKTEADNVFAVFPDVPPAVATAIEIQQRLDAANVFLPEDWDLHASLGIGYGELLMIGDDDMYGNEMNIASKLGEDIAGRGEVFLSEAAHARAPEGKYESRQIPISAMVVTAYKLLL